MPRSATTFIVNLFAISISMLSIFYFKWNGNTDNETATRWAIGLYALIVCTYELIFLKPYLNPSSGLQFDSTRPRNLSRIVTRIFGFMISVAFVALIYWICNEYQGTFYTPYWSLLKDLCPLFIIAVPMYFYWIDAFQKEPDDIYFQIGSLVIRSEKNFLSSEKLRKHFLGWLIKGFFFPLMYIYASKEVTYLLEADLNFNSFIDLYNFLWHFIFGIDVLIVSIGYLFTFQVLDSHLRSPQPSAVGWFFALICYQPFWSVIGNQYLTYEDNLLWDDWLASYPLITVFWGIAILLLITIYSLSTVAFGLRFSNLTNRGIITGGPYRWTKHPAYLSKNLAWWLISIPFVSQISSLEALKNCLGILLLNMVYFIRAKTEEAHLREDPAYRAYSQFIEQHGLFARLKRQLICLKEEKRPEPSSLSTQDNLTYYLAESTGRPSCK